MYDVTIRGRGESQSVFSSLFFSGVEGVLREDEEDDEREVIHNAPPFLFSREREGEEAKEEEDDERREYEEEISRVPLAPLVANAS